MNTEERRKKIKELEEEIANLVKEETEENLMIFKLNQLYLGKSIFVDNGNTTSFFISNVKKIFSDGHFVVFVGRGATYNIDANQITVSGHYDIEARSLYLNSDIETRTLLLNPDVSEDSLSDYVRVYSDEVAMVEAVKRAFDNIMYQEFF